MSPEELNDYPPQELAVDLSPTQHVDQQGSSSIKTFMNRFSGHSGRGVLLTGRTISHRRVNRDVFSSQPRRAQSKHQSTARHKLPNGSRPTRNVRQDFLHPYVDVLS